MTLIEKIEQDIPVGEKFLKENPNFKSVWLQYNEVPLEEIRECNKKYPADSLKPSQWDGKTVMCLQYSSFKGNYNFTIFAHSLPIKVETHYVETSIIENV